jgi:hypothetical protein
MEDKAAGKHTPTNPIPTPKKSHNPIAIESQWSLGWNTSKDLFNRPDPTHSKGNSSLTQASTLTITRATSSSGKATPAKGKKIRR